MPRAARIALVVAIVAAFAVGVVAFIVSAAEPRRGLPDEVAAAREDDRFAPVGAAVCVGLEHPVCVHVLRDRVGGACQAVSSAGGAWAVPCDPAHHQR